MSMFPHGLVYEASCKDASLTPLVGSLADSMTACRVPPAPWRFDVVASGVNIRSYRSANMIAEDVGISLAF